MFQGKILAEYYDSEYQLLDVKEIDAELPIFGGFYASDSNYFLVTGQNNPEESAQVEVYRITKYDRNWNRLGSAGLYDCNTTVPFDAGTVRMDMNGNYLLIRTSHEMYQSADGLNHQANVAIQVDVEKMEITDSYTGVMNNSYGYVSHSFNQFVRAEGNHMIAVDHGDAYPRSLVLIKYQTDLSSGKFVPTYSTLCSVINVLEFPGAKGENKTGASAGGFEISSSSYLVAGNSVVQDENNLTRTTRNVFVAAVNKESNAVTVNWLTDYTEGDGTVSTPQMTKIGTDQYMVLWSKEQTVYYTVIDGNGNSTKIYEMPGNLSDCVPVVNQNKLVWYTWKNETITFYEIDLSSPEQAQTTVIKNGHEYQWVKTDPETGMATLTCSHCNDTKEVRAATSMSVWWNQEGGAGHYWSVINTPVSVGDELYCWITVSPNAEDRQIEVTVDDPDMLSWTLTDPENNIGILKVLKAGSANVRFAPRYNPELFKEFTIQIKSDIQITSFTADPQSPREAGTEITLRAEAAKGIGDFTYRFYEKDADERESEIRGYAEDSSCKWIPDTTGNRTLYVDVKDSDGTVVTESLPYTVTKPVPKASDFVFTEPENLIYDGKSREAQLVPKDGINGMGDVSLKYYDAQGQLLTDLLTESGTYTVKIDVEEGANYEAAKDLGDVSWIFTIAKAAEVPDKPQFADAVSHGLGTAGKLALPDNWKWSEDSRDLALQAGGSVTGIAEYVGDDRDNYEKLSYEISITADAHSGGTATCASKAVCTVCGEEYGEFSLTNHTWENDFTVDREATCTEAGSKSIHCQDCDAVKDETAIPASEHSFGEYVSDENASCKEDGTKTAVCVNCGEKDTVPDEGSKLPHSGGTATCASPAICEVCGTPYGETDPDNHTGETELRNAKEATCSEEGYTGDTYCSGCGELLMEGTSTEKIDHTFGEWETVESPGCEDTGSKRRVCQVCGLEEYGDVDPTGHDWEDGYTVDREATCTEDGVRSIHCKNCEVTKDSEAIPASGHSFGEYVSDGNASCTSDGTKTAECANCGEKHTVPDEGSKLPHSGGTATCAAPAVCEVCGESYGETDPDNHAGETELRNQKEATCTEKGYSGDLYCKDCGAFLKQGQETEALEHDWEDNFTVDVKATCITEGSKSIHCKNCDAQKDITIIPLIDHDFQNYVPDGNATCTADGTRTGTCTVCGVSDTIADEGSKLPHTGGTATCKDQAVCEVCGTPYGETDPDNHTGETEIRNQKDATCTEAGYTGDTCCTDCGEVLETGTVIEKTDHIFGEWELITSPGCADKGSKRRICESCGYTEWDDVDPAGHDWEDEYTVDQEATCTSDGSRSIHCKNCQVTRDSETIPALGHRFGEYVSDGNATCTADGTRTRTCTICGASDTIADVGSKLPHTGGTATATSRAVCQVCGEEYGELAPAGPEENPAGKPDSKPGNETTEDNDSDKDNDKDDSHKSDASDSDGNHGSGSSHESSSDSGSGTQSSGAQTDEGIQSAGMSPQTGDQTDIIWYAVLLMLSLWAVIRTVRRYRKQ